MTTALLIIDVQNDFTEGGPLGVDGGHAVAAAISQLLADRAQDYALTVASADWHDADSTNGGHIVAAGESPDFVHTWPAHCISGSTGAQFDPALKLLPTTVIVHKGQGIPAYSLFEGVIAEGPDAGSPIVELLRAHGVSAVDVVGIATDYCVRASALDALAAGFDVRLLTDLIAAVAPESGRVAVEELRAAGVSVVAR